MQGTLSPNCGCANNSNPLKFNKQIIFINRIVWNTTDNYVFKVAHTVTLQCKQGLNNLGKKTFRETFG